MDSENAQRSANVFDKVQISLDSINEDINDHLRGKTGHLKSVRRAVELLRSHDVSVQISATVTKLNYDEAGEINKAFPDCMVKYTPMSVIGRGKANSCLAFSPEEYTHRLFQSRASQMDDSAKINVSGRLGARAHLCGAATGILSIDTNGDVYPCQAMHFPEFWCGNTEQEPLEEIYRSSSIIQRFRNLSVDDINGCKDCSIRYVCAGGCRAHAFSSNGGLLERDSYCVYNEAIFLERMGNCFEMRSI